MSRDKIDTKCLNCKKTFKTSSPEITVYCCHDCSIESIERKKMSEIKNELIIKKERICLLVQKIFDDLEEHSYKPLVELLLNVSDKNIEEYYKTSNKERIE